MEVILQLLCSSTKLERDRGAEETVKYLNSENGEAVLAFNAQLLKLCCSSDERWEVRHGGLMGAKVALSVPDKCTDDFAEKLQDAALNLLEDKESRVRLAAGEVMGTLCQRNGSGVYESAKEKILRGIHDNLERKAVEAMDTEEQEQADKLADKLSSSPRSQKRRASAEDIFHDTAGWKSLETWMKCLQHMIVGCGPSFNSHVDQDLLDLIFQALTHTNRFVRETGFYVCGSLVSCNTTDTGVVVLGEDNAIFYYGDQFAQHVGNGLADNWSQVRLAASVAARNFLEGLPTDEERHKFYPTLLPRLCLNRYYVAEGVRIYNQETWKRVVGTEGKHLVALHIQHTVDFYISQTEADNHAVREAACACIAELGAKIEKDVVRPHVGRLLDALLVCFKDQSWPVRDASCVACGNFIQCFPDEAKSFMDELYPLFYENLQDNIPSVRQGAALALANVIKAYGKEASILILAKAKEGLGGVEKQPENTEKYSSLDKGPATYGVVKRLRDNDLDLHTDRQMYSCGSLAPKMHRGTRGGGCMDHQFKRPAEQWELAEGCIHLVSEMAQLPDLKQEVGKLLPVLAKAASYRHYTQHVVFLETFCKQIPRIANGLGKKPFKMYLELFMEPIFYSLGCDNALTSAGAEQCLAALGKFLGPNILRGRVELYDPRYIEQLDRAISHMPPW